MLIPMERKKKNKNTRKAENGFSKNLKLLKERFPHLWEKVQAAKNPDRSPQLADFIQKAKFLFYRDEDPIVSVRKIIDDWSFDSYDVLFIIGMGLGYLPAEAIKKGIGNPRMVIIEPSEETFCNALENTDLKLLLKNDRVDLLIGDDVHISNIVDRFQEKIPIGKNQVIVHPNYEKVFGEKISLIKQELSERIRAVRDNWFTTKKYGQQMFSNAVANLPSLFAGTPMRNVRGKFKGIPAVCVAAGPSLDHAISDLKILPRNVLLIACDSAVKALLKAGVRPHVVVTTDIFETNIDKLKPHFEELRETIIIYSIESNPENVCNYLGTKRVAVSAYSKLLLSWIDPNLNLECKLPAMASVSHMAIFSAMALGADPIVMVGMDLAYSDGKSHSFDSVFFHSLDNKKMVPTLGNKGCMVSSSPQFVADKLLIEKIIVQNPVRFINTSVDGAYISGTEVKRLTEVVNTIECTSQLDAGALLGTIDWAPVADGMVASMVIEKLTKQFVDYRQLCSDKKKELLGEIDQIENRSQKNIDLELIVKFENGFDEFEKNNQRYKHMIKEIMLADLQEILKQKEILSVSSDKNGKNIPLEKLKLLAEQYEIYEKGMDLQINQLKTFGNFANRVVALNREFPAVDSAWDKHLNLARYFNRSGELWQAVREYKECMNRKPDDITPHVELAQALIDSELWPSARAAFTEAKSIFGDLAEVQRIGKAIADGVDAIFEKMKKEWTQGNILSTRKLLAEYMMLRPNDSQSIELKRVIAKLDQEFAAEWTDEQPGPTALPDMPTRLKMVVAHVKNKQLEKGIGILEGLCQDFPENRAAFREQIGDIRMMHKDYQSAMWNYRQAMEIDPLKIEINYKIGKIMHKLSL